jgi:hypothetical protein
LASYTKYNPFVENQLISAIDWNADTFKVALTNTAPNTSTHDTFDDITEISAGNGYTARGTATTISHSRSSGTSKIVGTDVVFTASGGTIGPFRYAVLYRDTGTDATSWLVASWDYGSSITLANGETFTVDFDATNGIFQIS